MAAGMTYDSLVSDIQTYSERNDTDFVNQIPRFVMLAENKIAREVRNLGFIRYVNGTFNLGGTTFAKPARWRQTISFNFTNSSGDRTYLFPRSYDYCRGYWPDPTQQDAPKYYADYDYEHYFIVPTPNSAYNFELSYHERPQPLDSVNQTSWTTQYAPQLILYACMVEASTFLKNMDKVQLWQGLYQAEVTGLAGEEGVRAGDDRATTRKQT